MADELRDWISKQYPSTKCESPIEQLFYSSYVLLRGRFMVPEGKVQLEQQAEVGRYRADFLFIVRPEGEKPKYLVVELDGHDFHERTKQQATKDKARDRWMTENHYHVMRYTGSEVWKNPFACVEEVCNRVHQLTYGVSRKEAIARAGFEALRQILEG